MSEKLVLEDTDWPPRPASLWLASIWLPWLPKPRWTMPFILFIPELWLPRLDPRTLMPDMFKGPRLFKEFSKVELLLIIPVFIPIELFILLPLFMLLLLFNRWWSWLCCCGCCNGECRGCCWCCWSWWWM